MPNGNDLTKELKYEEQIGELSDRELAEFNARTLFRMSNNCALQDGRISNLEKGDKKRGSLSGGISGTITAVIIGVISYFTNRGG